MPQSPESEPHGVALACWLGHSGRSDSNAGRIEGFSAAQRRGNRIAGKGVVVQRASE